MFYTFSIRLCLTPPKIDIARLPGSSSSVAVPGSSHDHPGHHFDDILDNIHKRRYFAIRLCFYT